MSEIHGNVKLYKKPAKQQTKYIQKKHTDGEAEIKQIVEQIPPLQLDVVKVIERTTDIETKLNDIHSQCGQLTKQFHQNHYEITSLLQQLLIQMNFLLSAQHIPEVLHRPIIENGLRKETYFMVSEEEKEQKEETNKDHVYNNQKHEIQSLKKKVEQMTDQIQGEKTIESSSHERQALPNQQPGEEKRFTFRDIQTAQSIQPIASRKTNGRIQKTKGMQHGQSTTGKIRNLRHREDPSQQQDQSRPVEQIEAKVIQNHSSIKSKNNNSPMKNTDVKMNVMKPIKPEDDQERQLKSEKPSSQYGNELNEQEQSIPQKSSESNQKSDAISDEQKGKSDEQSLQQKTAKHKNVEPIEQSEEVQSIKTTPSLFKNFWKKFK